MKRIICLIIVVFLLLSTIPWMIIKAETNFENIAPHAELTPLTVRSSKDHLRVTDGIKDVSKHSEGWQVRKETYMRFDFGKMVSFNKIDIYEINTTKVQRLKGYKVEASQNATEWETIAVVDETNNTCPIVIDEKHFKGEIEFEKISARFLKLSILKAIDPSGDANKNIGYVEEIEIFDTKPNVQGRVIESTSEYQEEKAVKTEIKMIDYSEIMENEAEWLRNQQINAPGSMMDGAIVRNKSHLQKQATTDKNYYTVEPYFATLACIGLLDDVSDASIETVKKWVDWYIRHINREPDVYGITGTIYTVNVNADDYNDYWNTGDYSASDSRGTTFVLLLKKLYDVTGDAKFFIDRRADIELILNSAIVTMRDDGLTDAKEQDGHRTKYLQDNIQVLTALKSMVELERDVFKDPVMAEHYNALYKRSEAGIESMWMEDKKEYIYYITPNKTRLCDWTVFYGDAVSEVFPVLYDAMDPQSERAHHLYKRLNTEHPGRVARVKANEFPWMATAIISAKMGDFKRADEQLATAIKRHIDTGRLWPWYIFEAGNAIRAAKETRDRLNMANGKNVTANNEQTKLLTDGRFDTVVNTNSIVIDLGDERRVNRAILKGDVSYTLSYSVDGANFNLIGNSNSDVYNFDKVSGRYFKFEISENANIKEAELYYNPENLLKNKPVTASSNGDKIFNANDNSTATKWLSNVEETPHLIIDMGQVNEIDSVEILWDYNNYSKEYGVYVSSDNVNYEKVFSTTTGAGGNETVYFELKQARFIKVSDDNPEKNAIGIFEVSGYNHQGTQVVKDNDLYKIYVDRVKIPFDVDPLMKNDRLLVPFRAICEALSMTVGWDDAQQKVTATKNDTSIEMIIENANISVNGKQVVSDVAPTLHNSRTLIPLRFLAEAIGCEVGWSGETNTVTITTK